MLHEVPAGVVDDDGVGDRFAAELVGGQRGALVAGAGLIDPDMNIEASAVGLVDRRKGRAPVDGGQPTGIAVGEDVEGLPGRAAASS